MYILTSKYFPLDYWPDDYFPALPDVAVVIRYTEVMDFAVCIATSAEFDVIMPNDASVDVGSTDIIVSGAGNAAANGTYIFYGYFDNKPYYKCNETGSWLIWGFNDSSWEINNDFIDTLYCSYDDVATPDLCTTWELGVSGVLPLPTVITTITTPTLTEVAIFTLEMPQIIEMEVYEELSL